MKRINWFWMKENVGKPLLALVMLFGVVFVLGILSYWGSKLFMAGWGLFN